MLVVVVGGVPGGLKVSDSAFELLYLRMQRLEVGSAALLGGPPVPAELGQEASHVLPPEVHVSESRHDDVGYNVSHGDLGGGFGVPAPMRPVGQHCIPVGGGRGEP